MDILNGFYSTYEYWQTWGDVGSQIGNVLLTILCCSVFIYWLACACALIRPNSESAIKVTFGGLVWIIVMSLMAWFGDIRVTWIVPLCIILLPWIIGIPIKINRHMARNRFYERLAQDMASRAQEQYAQKKVAARQKAQNAANPPQSKSYENTSGQNGNQHPPLSKTPMIQGIDPFAGCQDVKSVQKRYKELMRAFHPDLGNGDTATTQYINTERDKLLKKFDE